MSDTKIFGETTYTVKEFVGVEHGTEKISLSIFNYATNSNKILLDPDEAIRLAEDLIRRAKMIKGK